MENNVSTKKAVVDRLILNRWPKTIVFTGIFKRKLKRCERLYWFICCVATQLNK